MSKVKTSPIMEAIAKKLSGIGTVPVIEQGRMIQRACKVADEMHKKQSALIAELAEILGWIAESSIDGDKYISRSALVEHAGIGVKKVADFKEAKGDE